MMSMMTFVHKLEPYLILLRRFKTLSIIRSSDRQAIGKILMIMFLQAKSQRDEIKNAKNLLLSFSMRTFP